ncbi:MAG: nucleotidyl transferase AbiEii/AbiGii toxin family protein [Chlamydiales bacterium]
MNLFDRLIAEALKNQPDLFPLRIAVEKELLHHDILRILRQSNLTTELTFIGGTCLRTCYGGVRLSEDLDFTGGSNFSRTILSTLGDTIIEGLQEKYGLPVTVSEPVKDVHDVNTWKIKVFTRPETNHLPIQRINIDICSVNSYEKSPVFIQNHYGIDMGTDGLVIQAQSREEIYADKLIAFALRPNRLKYRDLWDMVWLHQRGIQPRFHLIPLKLQDRNISLDHFRDTFDERLQKLREEKKFATEFKKEMDRFLPPEKGVELNQLWPSIIFLINELQKNLNSEEISG